MRRSIQILMILIVGCMSGSHLALLQAVAWTGMLVENVEGRSLDEAISRTFDGNHACGLCDAIADAAKTQLGDEREEIPLPTGQVLDLKLFPLDRMALIPPAPVRLEMVRDQSFCVKRALSPVVPPPRVV